jgi:hypothetical protein
VPRRRFSVLAAAALIPLGCFPLHRVLAGEITTNSINTLDEMWLRLKQCWRPPQLPPGHPGMQITAQFAFQRDGEIFGKPTITFESPDATQADSLAYRTAVMEALQRCTPMPFTDGMGGAIAGKPLRLRFDDRRKLPKPTERKAWLTTTIL